MAHGKFVFYDLAKELPNDASLRLDANGGLSFVEAGEWLKACDRIGIEFFEYTPISWAAHIGRVTPLS